MTDRKSHRVEIIEDVDVWVNRGLVAYKAGWKGPVVPEAFKKLMQTDKAKDITPTPKKVAK